MNKGKKEPFAKKWLGQNFLVSQKHIEKIVAALAPKEDETIVEIGPGRGALTTKLVESKANVVAIEIDDSLVNFLAEKFISAKNLKLIKADALQIDFNELLDEQGRNKLVANLPYYISTAILQKLIVQRSKFDLMILMFQKEVAERLMAKAGSSERGFLTVLADVFLHVEKLFDVPPSAFLPVPKIWSSVVRIKPIAEVNVDFQLFSRIVEIAFSHKRKTLINNLKRAKFENLSENDWLEILEKINVNPSRRAETLTREEWLAFYSSLLERVQLKDL